MSIDFSNVSYVYSPKSPFRYAALFDVNLHLEEGKFIAIVGRTGSGKSTLIQQLNALLVPTEGKVTVDEFVNSASKKERKGKLSALRKKVGLVFQFPEYQLFEDTVEDDVSFGPKNFGAKKDEALKEAHEALSSVGLGESFYKRSPFELSGGEKRKVAIAGILAIHPSVLVVDEPTAGLDPASAKETMELFKKIKESGTTLILVTHDMDLVLAYAEEVLVISDGKIALQKTPEELFGVDLEKYSLEKPHVYAFAESLLAKGYQFGKGDVKDVKSLAKAIRGGQKHV